MRKLTRLMLSSILPLLLFISAPTYASGYDDSTGIAPSNSYAPPQATPGQHCGFA